MSDDKVEKLVAMALGSDNVEEAVSALRAARRLQPRGKLPGVTVQYRERVVYRDRPQANADPEPAAEPEPTDKTRPDPEVAASESTRRASIRREEDFGGLIANGVILLVLLFLCAMVMLTFRTLSG